MCTKRKGMEKWASTRFSCAAMRKTSLHFHDSCTSTVSMPRGAATQPCHTAMLFGGRFIDFLDRLQSFWGKSAQERYQHGFLQNVRLR